MWKLMVAGALLLFSTSYCFPNRANFGEPCGDRIRCDARASLTCTNSTCSCVKPDEMTYDKERVKCVVLSGERCAYTVEIEEDKKLTENLDCVSNANCTQDGFCACNSDHLENFERLCFPRKGYGENCTSDEQCQAKLLCGGDGSCVCKEGIGIVHEPINGGCVLQEGQICRNENEKEILGACVSNAVCSPPYDSGYNDYDDRNYRRYHSSEEDYTYNNRNPAGYCRCNSGYQRTTSGLCQPVYNTACTHLIQCVGNLVCNSEGICDCAYPKTQRYTQDLQTCECSSGFKLDVNGKCLAEHNITCSYSSECADNLVCVGKKCVCPFPNYQNYKSGILEGCMGDIGSPCAAIIDDQLKTYPCIKNAHCKNSSGISECVCNEGFIQGGDKQCEIAYGQPCSATVKCDGVAGLVCKNEICSCPFLQEYDGKVQKCRGLVGAIWDPMKKRICVDGAKCDRFKFRVDLQWNLSPFMKGVCRCNKTYELSSDRKCILLHSATSTPTPSTHGKDNYDSNELSQHFSVPLSDESSFSEEIV